jgi:hypothetical protein
MLVADEMGGTDFHNAVGLSASSWAKKILDLDRPEADAAELLFYGDAAQVVFNGTPLEKPQPLTSSGWQRVKVPPSMLRSGANEVVLRGPGSLLVEPGSRPGRSLRSTDGGRTWSGSDLGGRGAGPGEYLVRLRLARHPRSGWAQAPVLDLWAERPGSIGLPGRLKRVLALTGIRQGQLPGTAVIPLIRTGSTPTPDQTWTDWLTLDRDYTLPDSAARHRWAQMRFELGTDKPLSSPALPRGFTLAYDFAADKASADALEIVTTPTPRPLLPSSVPFVYQAPSGRLQRLRERHQLDKVIAPGKTELQQLVLLRHWVRHQWHTAWEGTGAGWMPPWDALMILDSRDRPDCLTMCTHYAAVYTQCCLALGWHARHCILDHHCVSEVYVNQHRKWVMMDAGNSKERPDCTLHIERGGIPLSALEIHLAQRSGRTSDLTVCFVPASLTDRIKDLCRPAPPLKRVPPPRPDTISAADFPRYPVCGLENFRRYAFPPRNNYLDSLLPGELYQGWSHYFYDGYCWVGDTSDAPERSPEYSRHLNPDRPQDIDWPLNETRIHLARTEKSGELAVQLETVTPNLARLERQDGASWKPTPATFTWKLLPGKNALRVRSVNRFDRPGSAEQVDVVWTPR